MRTVTTTQAHICVTFTVVPLPQCRPIMVLPSEELRMVEKLSQLLAPNSVGQRSSSDPSKHCNSFSSHSELSAVSSPWPARLPVSWPCLLTQAPGQDLSPVSIPSALLAAGSQVANPQAKSPAQTHPDEGSSSRPYPTHLLTEAQCRALGESWPSS